jgi:hypothetical protein
LLWTRVDLVDKIKENIQPQPEVASGSAASARSFIHSGQSQTMGDHGTESHGSSRREHKRFSIVQTALSGGAWGPDDQSPGRIIIWPAQRAKIARFLLFLERQPGCHETHNALPGSGSFFCSRSGPDPTRTKSLSDECKIGLVKGGQQPKDFLAPIFSMAGRTPDPLDRAEIDFP